MPVRCCIIGLEKPNSLSTKHKDVSLILNIEIESKRQLDLSLNQARVLHLESLILDIRYAIATLFV